jgi:para-nitrobenzyl esterase
MSRRARWRLTGALVLPLVIAGLGLPGAAPAAGSSHASAAVASAAAGSSHGGDGALVRTEDGLLRGSLGDGVRTFVGVPFAAPPVGQLRWRPPQPVRPWHGVRDATTPGSPCPALPTVVAGDSSKGGSTNEDCLYLNVTTPTPLRHRLPVMLWIHGGGFLNGAGTDYDAAVLAREAGAVVVTINYRLGPFGFLALPGLSAEARDHASGNFGLQDQQAAMAWVRRNIAGFGGDPRKVTIFGESAGGISVCAQLASPLARGLFQRAITQSGPCTARSRTLASAEASGAGLAARLGCADAATQVACMRGKGVAEILAAGGQALGSFGPVVGGALLPRQIPDAIASGRFNHVPVIEGTNHDEYRLFVALFFDLQGNPVTAAQYPALLQAQFGAAAPAVLARYPLSAFATPSEALATVVTDSGFACPARAADALLSRQVRTFAYEFNDPNAPEFLITDPVMPLRAFHAAEIPYIFRNAAVEAVFTPDQLALSRQMIGYWSRFAATGDPNGRHAPHWPRYRTRSDLFQSLAPAATRPIASFAADHNCAFWASLGA